MKNLIKLYSLIFASLLIISCGDEDLEPTLALDKDTESGIQNAGDLAAVLNSAYNRMTTSSYYMRDFIVMGEVRTDNMYSNVNSGRFVSSDMNHNPDGYGPWATIYRVIAITNIVANVDASSLQGNPAEISHIQGQALALRALCHFDLLRQYGQHFIDGQGGASSLGVPYVKTYKDPANLLPSRDTVVSNVGDILSDFQTGISMMSSAFDTDSSYMSQAGAYALMARAALYFGSVDSSFYSTAGSAAKWVIDNASASPVSAAGFRPSFYTDNASNSLFELEATGTDNPGINSIAYIYRGASYGDVRILTGTGTNPDLFDIFAGTNDVRASSSMIGIAQGYPSILGKYPSANGADNITVIRVEEMHLIYAEALLRAGNSSGALTYLNNVPSLRNAPLYTSATLDNILLERRKEFYGEGLRFYDLARSGKDMPLIDTIKQLNDDLTGTPPQYGSYRYAYPISLSERNANPNIVQNAGY
ncbi:MAG: RagB/SusD family nutrient uptake outer membrane protein [Flavobacteriaceae bacterium]